MEQWTALFRDRPLGPSASRWFAGGGSAAATSAPCGSGHRRVSASGDSNDGAAGQVTGALAPSRCGRIGRNAPCGPGTAARALVPAQMVVPRDPTPPSRIPPRADVRRAL